jgi:hypothetical protein
MGPALAVTVGRQRTSREPLSRNDSSASKSSELRYPQSAYEFRVGYVVVNMDKHTAMLAFIV